MSKWQKVKLGDLISLQRGYDLTKEQIVQGPYPVVSSTSIMGYHNSFKVEAPGVIIGRSGTLGEVQYVNTNCGHIIHLCLLRISKVTNLYLFTIF